MHDKAEINEVRMLLRWAAKTLTDNERAAIAGFIRGITDVEVASMIGITKGGVWMARQSGFEKMRRRLKMFGITSVGQLISERQYPNGWVSPPGVDFTARDHRAIDRYWRQTALGKSSLHWIGCEAQISTDAEEGKSTRLDRV